MNTKKKDLALQPHMAVMFAQLEAGEELSRQEEAKIRANLLRLLTKIRAAMFVGRTDEHRAWIALQQAYTGRIVAALERAHFARLKRENEFDLASSDPVWLADTLVQFGSSDF